jgi:DNA-binding CsgD family transcriptional regulator
VNDEEAALAETWISKEWRSADAGPEVAFVGRVPELEILAGELEIARSGRPRFLLLTGESGVGKTRLIHQFLGDFARGFSIVHAQADETEIGQPFNVVRQCGLIESDLSEGVIPSPSAMAADILERIGVMQRNGPVFITIDDAQSSDVSSLQAMTTMFRRLRADRVLIVMMWRSDALERIPLSLDRLSRSAAGRRVNLTGLGEGDLESLSMTVCGRPLRADARRRLWEYTRGHPMWLTALLRELSEQDILARHSELPAPVSLATIVRRRLEGCSDETRRLLALVAVWGKPIRLDLAGSLAELSDPLRAADGAVAQGLVAARGQPPDLVVECLHPLIRSAIYYDITLAERSRLHAVAGKNSTDRADVLRHRVAGISGPDEDLASQLVAHSRFLASRGAWAAAARNLETAARIHYPGNEQEALNVQAADAWLVAGEGGAAARVVASGLGNSPRAALVRGMLAFAAGSYAESSSYAEAAWTQADPVADAEVRARAAQLLGHLDMMRGRIDEGVLWCERAIEAAPNQVARNSARGMQAVNLALIGRTAEAFTLLREVPEVGDLSADMMEPAIYRGIIRLFHDDVHDARNDLARTVAAADRYGLFHLTVHGLGNLAEAEYRLGDWDAAIAHGHQAVSLGVDMDQVALEACLHSVAMPVLARRGEWNEAANHVHAAQRSAARTQDTASVGYAGSAAARLEHSRGDWEGVLAATDSLNQWPIRQGLDEPGVHEWRILRAEALVRTGRLADADRACAAIEELARQRGRRSAVAGALRARGLLEAAHHQHEEAIQSLTRASDHFDAVSMPFERAYTQLLMAEMLAHGEIPGSAQDSLDIASGVFSELKAAPFLARAQSVPRSGPSREPARRAWTRLTAQEIAVARLVTSGLSNRQAARQLVLSEKTIEFHLGNIYRKVDVESRSALTAWWHVQGRAPI